MDCIIIDLAQEYEINMDGLGRGGQLSLEQFFASDTFGIKVANGRVLECGSDGSEC